MLSKADNYCQPIGGASIVPSFDPQADANTLSKLFPKRFAGKILSSVENRSNGSNVNGLSSLSLQTQLSSIHTSDTVFLRGIGYTPSLLLVNYCSKNKNNNSPQLIITKQHQQQQLLAAYTILVFDRDEIMSAYSMLQQKIPKSSHNGRGVAIYNNASICFISGGQVYQRPNKECHWGLTQKLQDKNYPHAAMLTLLGNNNNKNDCGNGDAGSTLLLVTSNFFEFDMDAIRTVLELVADTINERVRNKNSNSMPPSVTNNGPALQNCMSLSSATMLPPPPSFPTLEVSVLTKPTNAENYTGKGTEAVMTKNFLTLNARSGTPFETDLFKGKVLLIIRPPDPANNDPYWNERVFSKKKRRFELQIQGRFKRVPTGVMYCGGEITQWLQVGFLIKGLCNIILRLAYTLNPVLHHSYGDENDTENAHMVFPAWTSLDSLVMSKPGDEAPPMGSPFPESKTAFKERKKSGNHAGNWNTTDTFSMSFHSMYMDLQSWTLTNLGVVRDTDLRRFWSDAALRFVIYEKGQQQQPTNSPNIKDELKHLKDQNTYAFSIQLSFLGEQQSGQKQNLMTLPEEQIESQKCNGRNGESALSNGDRMQYDVILVENEREQPLPRNNTTHPIVTQSVYTDSNTITTTANNNVEKPLFTELPSPLNSRRDNNDDKSSDGSDTTNYFDVENNPEDEAYSSSEMGDISFEFEGEELHYNNLSSALHVQEPSARRSFWPNCSFCRVPPSSRR